MSPKTVNNLRFLLSLGNTKMVILQDTENMHIYSSPTTGQKSRSRVTAEHVAAALVEK
ncbi:MAG: hypothetical protein J6Y25_02325 [Elusimicrobiaceae bacterium]|nr:hypothetical protein [Elusimicrobiaceae bacterium]MBP5616445.1 hypothetical protein [Elusimicrobiaceae bacterium]